MSKRVYVAIGGVGMTALKDLVQRYLEEGHFDNPSGKFKDDVFIGIDSDEGNVNTLGGLVANYSEGIQKHVYGIVLKEDHRLELERYRECFRDSQSSGRGQILSIAPNGVAGKRIASWSSLSWKNDRRFADELKNLACDDAVVLMGSAFGGTSTGSYWNIAQWINRKLREVRPDGALPPFFGFVTLPNPNFRDPAGYPWHKNCVSFLQEMQYLNLEIRLRNHMSVRPFRFLSPDYVRLGDNQLASGQTETGRVPLYEKRMSQDHSNFPMDLLFLVDSEGDAGPGHRMADEIVPLCMVADFNKKYSPKLLDVVFSGQGTTRAELDLPDKGMLYFAYVSATNNQQGKLWSIYNELLSAAAAEFLRDQGSATEPMRDRLFDLVLQDIESTTDSRGWYDRSDAAGDWNSVSEKDKRSRGVYDYVFNPATERRLREKEQYAFPTFNYFLERMVFPDGGRDAYLADPGVAEMLAKGDRIFSLKDLKDTYEDLKTHFRTHAEATDDLKDELADMERKYRSCETNVHNSFVMKMTGTRDVIKDDLVEMRKQAYQKLTEALFVSFHADATVNQLAFRDVPKFVPATEELLEKALTASTEKSVSNIYREEIGDTRKLMAAQMFKGTPKNDVQKLLVLTCLESVTLQPASSDVLTVLNEEYVKGRNAQTVKWMQDLRNSNDPGLQASLSPAAGFGSAVRPQINRTIQAERPISVYFYEEEKQSSKLMWRDLRQCSDVFSVFEQIRNPDRQALADVTDISAQEFKPEGDSYVGEHSGVFHKLSGIHQIWIGSLVSFARYQETIIPLLDAKNIGASWMNRFESDRKQADIRNIQDHTVTLRERLCLGSVLGILEDKIIDNIKHQGDGQTKNWCFRIRFSGNEKVFDFSDCQKAENTLIYCPMELFRAIVRWVQTDDLFKVKAFDDMERNILLPVEKESNNPVLGFNPAGKLAFETLQEKLPELISVEPAVGG